MLFRSAGGDGGQLAAVGVGVLGGGNIHHGQNPLRGVTSNAAYQYFEEGQKGSITPAKRADFVILDQNPLMVPLRQIKDIQVLHTIKDGEVLYSKCNS